MQNQTCMSDAAFAELERAISQTLATYNDVSVRELRKKVHEIVEGRRRRGTHVRETIADLEYIGSMLGPTDVNRPALIAEAVTAAIAAYYGLRYS